MGGWQEESKKWDTHLHHNSKRKERELAFWSIVASSTSMEANSISMVLLQLLRHTMHHYTALTTVDTHTMHHYTALRISDCMWNTMSALVCTLINTTDNEKDSLHYHILHYRSLYFCVVLQWPAISLLSLSTAKKYSFIILLFFHEIYGMMTTIVVY